MFNTSQGNPYSRNQPPHVFGDVSVPSFGSVAEFDGGFGDNPVRIPLEEDVASYSSVFNPISVVRIDANNIKVLFQAVKLSEVTWDNAGQVYEVTVNGVTIDGDPANTVDLPFPCVLNIAIATTEKGVITGIPIPITTDDASGTPQHHVPQSLGEDANDFGQTGYYTYVVGAFVDEGGVVTWKPNQSTLTWHNYTRENFNAGGEDGVGVFQQTTDEAKDYFRTLEGDTEDYVEGSESEVTQIDAHIEVEIKDGDDDVIKFIVKGQVDKQDVPTAVSLAVSGSPVYDGGDPIFGFMGIEGKTSDVGSNAGIVVTTSNPNGTDIEIEATPKGHTGIISFEDYNGNELGTLDFQSGMLDLGDSPITFPDVIDPDDWEELEISICIAGTPTLKTILVKK